MKQGLLLLLPAMLAFFSSIAGGKNSLPPLSKKGDFLFPISPGKVVPIWGNMGEIRTNHFHGGIDIPTEKKTGLPVYASKDGYISRVMVSGDGYGSTLMLTHPDGYVTLYAHLEKFSEPLHSFIKKIQYERKSFDLDYYPSKNQFFFRQGEVMALSGNSGRSAGPHLHFEIRDTSNMVYNPLAFGFPEVLDKIPPVVDRLAVVPLDMHARLNGRHEETDVPLRRDSAGDFTSSHMLEVSGTVGLEISARDKVGEGTSSGGIFCIEMYANGKLIYYHNLYQFPFNKSNHVNHLVNYRRWMSKGQKLQKLYYPDGYYQTRHTPAAQHGKICLRPGESTTVEIFLWDAHGNKKVCRVGLIGGSGTPPAGRIGKPASAISCEILDNLLLMKCNGDPEQDGRLKLFSDGKIRMLSPVHVKDGQVCFLHDLRSGLPDSVSGGGNCRKVFSFAGMFVPGMKHSFSMPGMVLNLEEGSLFDTLFLEAARDENAVYRLNQSTVPLAEPMLIQMAPGNEALADKLIPCTDLYTGKLTKALPVESRTESMDFKSKFLGRFCLLPDTTAPEIRKIRLDGNAAWFEIRDKLSDIGSWEASVNGDWILMAMDKKKSLISSDPWPSQLPMRGDFQLKVVDKAGNTRIYRQKI